MNKSRKVLSVFSLVMINVIAVDSLRTLPISAKLGFSLVFYYLPAALIFFIPIGLVAAELATAYPNTGGLYIWVREAFGRRAGFITIWLQWIYNVVWYPIIMAFIVATISYLFSPELAQNQYYVLFSSLGLFWFFTLMYCFGMRVSSIVSTLGALLGTILPMLVIIVLAAIWIIQGHPIASDIHNNWIPNFKDFGTMALFPGVLFGLIGLEMSAVHAEEVRDPQHDYPRAIIYSTLIIFLSLVLASLAIVIVVPNSELSVVSGLVDAYVAFFSAFNLTWMIPVLIILIVLGALSGVSAWIIGPTKGLLVSAQDGSLPRIFAKVNRHGAPIPILILQSLIYSLLSTVFLLSDSINAAYWMLSDLCSQLALLVYVFMFAAAIKLRYIQPNRHRSYRIPGGNWVMWLVAGSGIGCCLLAMAIGFVPPSQIPIKNIALFESFLIAGLVLFVMLPWMLSKRHEDG